MRLTINDEVRDVAEGATISDLVKELELTIKGIAIAVNQRVIARNEWEKHRLQEDDAIFIIQATHGG